MLYGREAECTAVDALLDGARASRSGVLVLRGEPGVGKSVLLAYGSDRAEGFRVLRATGIESESQLPFAGLHQLLWPVLDRVDTLHGPQAAALRAAFGLTDEGVGDRFLIYFGVLSLLAEVAEDGPLLCLVDDAQWLDDPSADALVFASRRLQAERVVMLFAAREGTDATFAGPGLPDLHVDGLDREAAGTLLAERGALSPEVRQQLFDATAGNPLALVELAAELTEAQLTGRETLPERLVLGSGVERAFLERVRELPDDSRSLLVLAAADDTGSLSAIFGAGTALGVTSDALAAAESAGLVRADDGHLHFRHPLVRSAVYQGASFAERQDAHLALAAALDGDEHSDRRAWHRAAATLGPDAEVADELERTADRARLRSGFAAAGAALERAAELSVDDRERARRYASAAQEAWLGGRPERARALLDLTEGLVDDERPQGRDPPRQGRDREPLRRSRTRKADPRRGCGGDSEGGSGPRRSHACRRRPRSVVHREPPRHACCGRGRRLATRVGGGSFRRRPLRRLRIRLPRRAAEGCTSLAPRPRARRGSERRPALARSTSAACRATSATTREPDGPTPRPPIAPEPPAPWAAS